MAKILISPPPFIGVTLPSVSRHGLQSTFPQRRLLATRVKFSLHDIPPIHSFESSINFNAISSRAEALLYTLADAAVAIDPAAGSNDATAGAAQKSGGWFGFISDGMEFILKVIVFAWI